MKASTIKTVSIAFGLTALVQAPIGQITMVQAQHRLAEDEAFTMALTGDSIITRKLSVYDEPQFLKMVDLIRGADLAFTNLEVLFHDYETYPAAESGGTWMRADPEMAQELAWAGFDMVARANNHSGDFGPIGQQITSQHVRAAGMVEAGVGNSLAEAREAKFLETSKARVALISFASTFANHMRAGRTRDNIPARPGLNPMRYSTTYELTTEQFEHMHDTAGDLGELTNADGKARGYDAETPDKLRAFGRNFERGEKPHVHTKPNDGDLHEVSSVVNNADRLSDYVIVTMHAHEGPKRSEPADFLPVVARTMIDNGADVFVGHGPHALRGIEIYKGKPIFYSLGDFIFQNETLLRMPADSFDRYGLGDDAHLADWNDARYENDTRGFPTNPEIWEGVIAVPTFEGDSMTKLLLYPVDLGYGMPRQVRGRPLLATGGKADKIITDLINRSAPYGTTIRLENGVGVVDLSRE